MTLNSEHDPDSVMMNHYVKYQGQVIVTHNRPNFSAWTHKVVSNYIVINTQQCTSTCHP